LIDIDEFFTVGIILFYPLLSMLHWFFFNFLIRRHSLKKMLHIDFSICLYVEQIECNLNIYFCKYLILINCSTHEFFKIDSSVSIKVTFFEDLYPSFSTYLFAFDLLQIFVCDDSVVIGIDFIKSIFHLLYVFFVSVHSHYH